MARLAGRSPTRLKGPVCLETRPLEGAHRQFAPSLRLSRNPLLIWTRPVLRKTGTRVGLSRSRRWRRPAASSLGLSMLSAAGLVDPIVSAHEAFVALSAGALAAHTGASQVTAWPAVLLGEEAGVGYSKFSYYTTLGLYVLSFPGLWSVVKRATKTK